ncbi:bile acid:sodium symporter, partial [Burkholderia vietnamiensis]|uniref:bile acid:sodium symporter n=1 Tax=Burkholderia vietnamiensis TaxID=60552 RepID=UPI001594E449
MLNRMSQFATKTFIFWMLVAAIIGFVFPSHMAILGGFVPYLLGIVILVGCCPGGTSSNVMSYLAKANVALSVAITSVSTLIAPFVTPALIYLFA